MSEQPRASSEVDSRNNFLPHTGIFWLRLYDQVERKLEENPNFLTTPEEDKTKELRHAYEALEKTVGRLSDSVLTEAGVTEASVCRDEPAGVQ
jgi:hypothetical protein